MLLLTYAASWSNMLLLIQVLAFLRAVVAQECTLPSAMDIETLVESITISSGGEGVGTEITLLDHHFTCLAVGSRADRYRGVSVAVRYNATQSGTTNMRLSQIQLVCNGGTHFTGSGEPFEAGRPESVLTLATRRDCRLCVITAPSAIVVEADANCACKLHVYMYMSLHVTNVISLVNCNFPIQCVMLLVWKLAKVDVVMF